MGEAYLDWQNKSGGIKLNDVIEEYRYVAAGKQIKAGDLVNYINGVAGKTDYGESVDTQLSTEANSGYAISAVQLDENRVFIVHRNSNNYLSGLVCTISGATITVGTDTELPTSAIAFEAFSICLLQNGNVFVAYKDGSTNQYLYGIVVSINGTTISTGGKTALVTTKNSGYTISTCLLPNGNVFIAHCYSSNYYLNGIVVSIDGTKITLGTDTTLVSSNYAGSTISTCLLPNGNVFIAHSYGSNYYLYGIVCSISGTTISKGTDTSLSTSNYGEDTEISVQPLSNGDVFVVYTYGNSRYLYGIVCSIEGTKVTKGTETALSTESNAGYRISTVLLGENKYLVLHIISNVAYLYGMICEIDGSNIITGPDTQILNGNYISYTYDNILLNNGTIFVAHSKETSYYLNAQIFGIDYDNNIPTNNIVITEYEQQVTPAIEPPFNAVALSSGVGGTDTEHNEQVKIARIYKEVKVLKEGNIFPTTWETVSRIQATASNGATIIATSSYEESTSPNLASDGDNGSYWQPNALVGSITMYLVEPHEITKMEVYRGNGIEALKVEGSSNNSEWVTLYETSDSVTGYDESVINLELSNCDKYLYYKLTATGTTHYPKIDTWKATEYVVTEVIQ